MSIYDTDAKLIKHKSIFKNGYSYFVDPVQSTAELLGRQEVTLYFYLENKNLDLFVYDLELHDLCECPWRINPDIERKIASGYDVSHLRYFVSKKQLKEMFESV